MAIDLTSDREVLAATIDGEGENQPLIGQNAIAATVLRRVALAKVHPHFGDGTIRGACLAPAQFDCWMPGADRDRIEKLDPIFPTPAFAKCLQIADDAIAGRISSFGNPTHYFADSIPAPAWVVGARFCGQYGAHLFWNGVK